MSNLNSCVSLVLFEVSHGRLATARKPERQVTRMVVVMIVAFMVGWTPYAAFAILVTAHPTIELDPRLASIPAFFSKTAAVYNPIIYVFMNRQVTEGFVINQGSHWWNVWFLLKNLITTFLPYTNCSMWKKGIKMLLSSS